MSDETTPPVDTTETPADAGTPAGDATTPPEGSAPPEGTPPAETTPPAPPEPQGRTTEDHIANRKQGKIEKLDAAIEAKKAELAKLSGTPPEGGDTPPVIDPATIEQIVENKYGTQLSALGEQQLSSEVDTFIATNKDFAAHKDTILKWAKHPAYKNIPVANVAYAALGEGLMKLGADALKNANADAKKKNLGGEGGKQVTTKPISEMTDAEVIAEQNRVRRGG